MSSIKDILGKTEFMLILSILIGLAIIVHPLSKVAIDYLLGIMIFFSIRPFFTHKLNIRERYKPIIFSVLLSYILLSGLFVIFGLLFFDILSPHNIGFILLAIVPPAISIVPLCYATRCNPETADASLFAAFMLSLIIIPLSMYLIFQKSVDMWMIIRIMMTIMIVPLILSFLMRKVKSKIFEYTKAINNICLSLVLIIAVSLNRNAFFILDSDILKIYAGVFLAIFGSGLLTYFILKRYYVRREVINFTLYASQKNEGTALAIAVSMFTPDAVIPIIFALVTQFMFFILFKKYVINNYSFSQDQ
jgi:BASS family bile acid:Na+ symporter